MGIACVAHPSLRGVLALRPPMKLQAIAMPGAPRLPTSFLRPLPAVWAPPCALIHCVFVVVMLSTWWPLARTRDMDECATCCSCASALHPLGGALHPLGRYLSAVAPWLVSHSVLDGIGDWLAALRESDEAVLLPLAPLSATHGILRRASRQCIAPSNPRSPQTLRRGWNAIGFQSAAAPASTHVCNSGSLPHWSEASSRTTSTSRA